MVDPDVINAKELSVKSVDSISGIIENSGTIYDGVYNNKTVLLEEFFLEFEHTDGLNYINAEIRRFDDLFALHKSIKMN